MNIKSILLLSICVLTASCVTNNYEDPYENQKTILEAYMTSYYPDAFPSESGLYVIDIDQVVGEYIEDTAYAYVKYSYTDLEGNYLDYSFEDVAIKLGAYKESNFYGNHVWPVGFDLISPGLEEIIMLAPAGATIEAVIPPWLMNEVVGSNTYYNRIYKIEVDTFVKNNYNYERELLQNFSNKYYGGLDSLEDGFYFKQIYDGGHKDTIVDGESIEVRYIGRLLDGSVFDTNVRDTADKYGLDRTSHVSLPFTFYGDEEQAFTENSLVEGFSYAVSLMGFGDKAVTYFASNWGYAQSGNMNGNSGVPAYYPIFFEIWIETEPI